MLTAPRRDLRRTVLAQDGFTLVELVVAMAAAIVVLFGLTTIMVVAMHQTQRTFTVVDATRQARDAMANIENELHSACVDGSAPIQPGSDADDLDFISYYGSAASPTPVWHQITFNPTAHTLFDTTYPVTANSSGTGGNWVQGSTATATTTLLSNVYAQTTGSVTTPVFQYFDYQADGTDAAGDTYYIVPDGTNLPPGGTGTPPDNPLTATLGTGLDQSDANNTVEVMINLLVGATSQNINNPGLTSADDPVTDAISLRLTTPPDDVTAGAQAEGYGPCE
jgi:hypothetical protein